MKQDPGYLAEAFYDALNKGALDEALELFSTDCDFHEPVRGKIDFGQFRDNLIGLQAAFPDAKVIIESSIISGTTAAVEATFAGWHTGPLVGPVAEFAATNKHLEMRFSVFIETADGKIVAHRTYFNQLDLVYQLNLFGEVGR